MKIPKKLVIEDGAYAMDGGSIALNVRDPEGEKYHIVLWQHMFTEQSNPDRMPGRLYFDKILIPVREDVESQILDALREARLDEAIGESKRFEESSEWSPGVIIGDIIRYSEAFRIRYL